jgi:hypothetical protein
MEEKIYKLTGAEFDSPIGVMDSRVKITAEAQNRNGCLFTFYVHSSDFCGLDVKANQLFSLKELHKMFLTKSKW